MRINIIPSVLALLALSPMMQAVTPAPDGGYAGNNTAEAISALFSLTSGIDNTALGFQALFHNNTGNSNTAEGFRALFANTNGRQNTATGVNALASNTTGDGNTAVGINGLRSNLRGSFNTALGLNALFGDVGDAATGLGCFNSASGAYALFANTSGYNNSALRLRRTVLKHDWRPQHRRWCSSASVQHRRRLQYSDRC